jgi:hypothetical protein
MNANKWLRAIIVMSLMFLFYSGISRSQTVTSGTVLGAVTDSTGGVVSGATVTLHNTATNESRTQTSNASGDYVFPSVTPGSYTLSVTAPSFKVSSVSEFHVDVAKSYNFAIALEVGQVTQQIQVTPAATVELQTTNAQIGTVIGDEAIQRLPTLQHDAGELVTLQPGVTTSGSSARASGNLDDQNVITLDGIDITDSAGIGSLTSLRTIVPIPADSVEEYRVGVSTEDASYGRAPGANVALVGRHGANAFHGAAYWYTQNSALNANSWDDNHLGIARPSTHDNRYGGRLGGPIQHNKTFFFANYEARRFPASVDFTELVPTASLKQGILKFRDGAGNVISYNLANAANCGAAGNLLCDPRSLGISPTISALFAKEPTGNNLSAGDGLNTTGYSSSLPLPLSTNYYLARVDHNINSNWRIGATYNSFNTSNFTAASVNILNANSPQAVSEAPVHGILASVSLNGTLGPSLVNAFHFGWLHDNFAIPTGPSAQSVAQTLNRPGTNSTAGFVNLALPALVNSPFPAPTQDVENDHNYQWSDDMTKIFGQHLINFGMDIRHLNAFNARGATTAGGGGGIQATVGTGSFLTIPTVNTPLVCATATSINCLPSSQLSNWGSLYALTLGMVDNNTAGIVRDNNLAPEPLGTYQTANETHNAFDFYVQDTWRIRPSLTLNFGLNYGWQQPPNYLDGRVALMTNASNGQQINIASYLNSRETAAAAGTFFDPQIAWVPINTLKVPAYNTNYGDIAPRVGVAWNPSYGSGILGKLFGSRKTVIRGGFGIYYDRINEINNVILPTLGVGFTSSAQLGAPNCAVSGTPGLNCNPAAGSTNPGMSWFRVGVDGNIPSPVIPSAASPIVPANPFGQASSFAIDPNAKDARNYEANVSIQHSFSGNIILELGWTGNYGRHLAQNINLSAVPYFMKDPNSSQTLAQAFDAVATQLRAGVAPAAVTPQKWFEDLLPMLGGAATTTLANSFRTQFINGQLGTIMLGNNGVDFKRLNAGLPTIDDLQVVNNYVRTDTGISNYNAGFVALRSRPTHGLTFDVSFTMSKGLDNYVINQDNPTLSPNSYFPGTEYGPSLFDRKFVLNGTFVYDLPFGKGHRFSSSHNWINNTIGGWYMSGIYTQYTGLPLTVTESNQVWGSGSSGSNVFAIPTGALPSTGVNSGVAGSGGVGTTGNPATGGTGLNLFANPAAALAAFRPVLISSDTQDGRDTPMRGLPFWNLDAALGKSTTIHEGLKLTYAFQFFNLFNNVNFATPALSLQTPTSFGVISNQFVPSNRQAGSRWIEFSARFDF